MIQFCKLRYLLKSKIERKWNIGEDVPLFPHKCPDGDYGLCEFESFKILAGEEQAKDS